MSFTRTGSSGQTHFYATEDRKTGACGRHIANAFYGASNLALVNCIDCLRRVANLEQREKETP